MTRRSTGDRFDVTIITRDEPAWGQDSSRGIADPARSSLTVAERSQALLVRADEFLVRVPRDGQGLIDVNQLSGDVRITAERLNLKLARDYTIDKLKGDLLQVGQGNDVKWMIIAEKTITVVEKESITVIQNGPYKWTPSGRYPLSEAEREALGRICGDNQFRWFVALSLPAVSSEPTDNRGLYRTEVDPHCRASFNWDYSTPQDSKERALQWQVDCDSGRSETGHVQRVMRNGNTISGIGFWRQRKPQPGSQTPVGEESGVVLVDPSQIAPGFQPQGKLENVVLEEMCCAANHLGLQLAPSRDLALACGLRWTYSTTDGPPTGELHMVSDGFCLVRGGYIELVPLHTMRERVVKGDFKVAVTP